MSVKTKKWLPAVLAPALVATLAVGIPLQATAEVDLPDKTASEILQFVNQDPNLTFSGTVVKTSNLGLPEFIEMPEITDEMAAEMAEMTPEGMEDFVPQVTEGSLASISDALEILTGTHTVRVFAGGENKFRAQVQDRMNERNMIVNGNKIWFYDSKDMVASFYEADQSEIDAAKTEAEAEFAANSAQLPFDAANPAEVADYFLSQIDESTEVTTSIDTNIAGRGSYQLVMTPSAAESTVENVTIAIDGETGLPLAVTVEAKNEVEPAFQIAFTSISFETPAASLFEFTPTADMTVEEFEFPELPAEYADYQGKDLTEEELEQLKADYEASEDKPVLTENGWASVVSISTEDFPLELLENEMFADLVTDVEGGVVFETSLVNVLITDDGRGFAGAVTVEYLLQVAKG